ncbi:hypothetical protein BZL39_J00130 [Zygosaccharomyces parabailii]|nr:hypothetical protein BZL39_J00130 [Zygosaccharomyces parabailii]CDH18137.1 related to GTPases (G3E family) [Zygosaccharomyces bailii ISA1307]
MLEKAKASSQVNFLTDDKFQMTRDNSGFEMTQASSIPVTILSGFLGSGKTTLLERMLTKTHGLKVAVIINDMSELNIDASLIQNHKVSKSEEKLIQLQNGCICCTLRGDLLEELVDLAQDGSFDYIVIESTGIAEPMQVAETFSNEFSEMLLETPDVVTEEEEKLLRKVLDLGGLEKISKIDTCVTVIDALNFFSNIETTEFLADRWGDNGQGERDRTITDLMVDQIEFSDVIIINKKSLVGKKKLTKIRALIKSLNPVAKILEADYYDVPLEEVLNTGKYSFEKAASSAGWLQSINNMTVKQGYGDKSRSVLTPKPETEEYGINNFVYQSRRPFHPERLYNLICDKFFVIEESASLEQEDSFEKREENMRHDDFKESEEDDDETKDEGLGEEEILKHKKNSSFGPLLRSKGFLWLATRFIQRGEWSSAGPMLTIKGGIPWFDVSGTEDIPDEALELIKKDFDGRFGDRRNEIVFIGLKIDRTKLCKELNSCLLNDREYKKFLEITREQDNLLELEEKLYEVFPDGFEEWMILEEESEPPSDNN